MTAEILAWFCNIFTNADANPSEQVGSSLGATGFFFDVFLVTWNNSCCKSCPTVVFKFIVLEAVQQMAS